MATIQRLLTKGLNSSGKAEVILRLSLTKDLKLRFKTGVFIDPRRFKDGRIIMPRGAQREAAELRKAEDRILMSERRLMEIVETVPREKWSKEVIQKAYTSEKSFDGPRLDFFELFDEFVDHYEKESTRQPAKSLERRLFCFQEHVRRTRDEDFTLDPENFTTETLEEFMRFLSDGVDIPDLEYPDSLKRIATCQVQPIGNNSLSSHYHRLATFFNWMVKANIITSSPLKGYQGAPKESYGTPFYLTKEERDSLADFDLSATPDLELVRDMFIFQCLVGCRVSDLLTLKKSSVVNGVLEYVPQKTSSKRKNTVKVPLNSRAAAIVEHYSGTDTDKLLPFKYNYQVINVKIKTVFHICGITRLVTVINPKTGKPEQRPLYEVASTHMARRTFIGLLYKQIKDPNLIGALSGHVEGSKAFTRYREIDDDMRRELVDLID